MNKCDILSEVQSFFEKKYPYFRESNTFSKKLSILYNKYNKKIIQQTNTSTILSILSIIKNQLEKKHPKLKSSKNFEIILRELLIKQAMQQNPIEKLSIHLTNTSDLFNKGWKLTGNLKNKYNTNYIPTGVLGKLSSGKTHLINLIISSTILEIPTDSINFYYLINQRNCVFIDTPGLGKELDDKNEATKRDIIIQSIILDNCINIFYVINSSDDSTKKDTIKIKRSFIQNRGNENTVRTLFIIHNQSQIKDKEDYQDYIENNILIDKNHSNFINGYITENIEDPYINENRRIIHFILSPYNQEKVIATIQAMISTSIQIPLLPFEDMIQKTFEYIAQGLYREELHKVIIKDKILKIEKTGKKEITLTQNKSDKNDEIEFEEKYENSIDLTPFEDYQKKVCPLSYYINNENHLVIIIESVNLKKVTINICKENENTVFYFIGKKDVDSTNTLYSNMILSDDIAIIEIPSSFAILNSFKSISHKYNSGILYLEYLLN